MFFLLVSLLSSTTLRPLILMPGLYGSNLYATYTDFAQHWYCSNSMDDEIVWVDATLAIPPIYNCLFEMLTCFFDEKSDTITSQPNIDIHTHDFGGVDGISKVMSLGSIKLIESFSGMVDYLTEKGYEVRKNLFGAPFDWRLGIAGLNKTSFFDDYRKLIEECYQKNENQRVVLLGYSLGSYVISHFLGNLMTEEWKEKYIEKIIFLAPALAGSGETLPVAWDRNFPLVPFITNDIIENCIEHMPVVHTLFPNHVVFENDKVIITPEKEVITPDKLPQFLVDQGKIQGDAEKMLWKSVEFSKLAPADPGVDIKVIYNSAIDTSFTLNFENGYDDDPTVEMVPGDGTVPAKGPEWIISHWNKNKKYILESFNLDRNDDDFDHMGIGSNDYVNELIFNYTNSPSSKSVKGIKGFKHGRTIVQTAPYIELTNTTKCGYIIRDDIRKYHEIDQ